MDAQILYRVNDILVTPTVARFGPISYQMSGITSVAVYHQPKLNPIAVVLVVAAVALAAFAYLAREQEPGYSLYAAIAAPIALILGVAWQRLRPVLEYRFVIKAAGGETETVTTFNREQVLALRDAVESAFLIRRPQIEQTATAPVEPPRPTEVRTEDGFQITRDWVVSHPDSR
ncbi:MAG: hypothetical protein GEU95_00355 [Rhizobiales bacterium]|nr:hypothetical protein [Hyphomicrobiales bacterium]